MKILSNFLVNLLLIFLSGSIWKVVFDTKKFGSKVNDRQYFYVKNSFSMKKLSINIFTTKLLSTFQMITKKFTKKFGSKVINRQCFQRSLLICPDMKFSRMN